MLALDVGFLGCSIAQVALRGASAAAATADVCDSVWHTHVARGIAYCLQAARKPRHARPDVPTLLLCFDSGCAHHSVCNATFNPTGRLEAAAGQPQHPSQLSTVLLFFGSSCARHSISNLTIPFAMHPSTPQAAWKPRPVSLNIPASTKPVRIVLEGTPLLKGMLVLTGCRYGLCALPLCLLGECVVVHCAGGNTGAKRRAGPDGCRSGTPML